MEQNNKEYAKIQSKNFKCAPFVTINLDNLYVVHKDISFVEIV
jgi:hypothetical protein